MLSDNTIEHLKDDLENDTFALIYKTNGKIYHKNISVSHNSIKELEDTIQASILHLADSLYRESGTSLKTVLLNNAQKSYKT